MPDFFFWGVNYDSFLGKANSNAWCWLWCKVGLTVLNLSKCYLMGVDILMLSTKLDFRDFFLSKYLNNIKNKN